MKKLLLVFVAVLAFAGLKAQNITIGPKVGFNVTNISHVDDSKNKLSLNLGAFAEFKLNDMFAIQPELIYSRQGFRDKDGGMKYKGRVNYLNIPVLAKLYIIKPLENFSIDLGPQFGFALNGKSVVKHDGTTVKEKMDHLNTFDLSLALGVSYNFDMGLMLSARYNFGLTNVFDKDAVGTRNKNHVFQLSAGWRLADLF